MPLLCPGFRGQVFQVNPAWLGLGPRHGLQVGYRQLARECLDHDIGARLDGDIWLPLMNFDAMGLLPGK